MHAARGKLRESDLVSRRSFSSALSYPLRTPGPPFRSSRVAPTPDLRDRWDRVFRLDYSPRGDSDLVVEPPSPIPRSLLLQKLRIERLKKAPFTPYPENILLNSFSFSFFFCLFFILGYRASLRVENEGKDRPG